MIANSTAAAVLLLALAHGIAQAADAPLVRPLPVPPSHKAAPTPAAPTIALPAVKQPAVAAQPPTTTTATSAAAIGPKWPVNFNLLEGEREGWGFVVGAPGAIDVRVQSQGAPIVVSLRKPDGNVVEQTGSGDVAIKLQATAADVARSVLWSVSVRGANAAPPSATGGKRELRSVARGTVNVAHPPGDARRAETEVKALAPKAQANMTQARPPANQPPVAGAIAKRQAELDQQTATRQAQLLERLRGRVPAEAFQRASLRIATRQSTDSAVISPQVRQQAGQFLANQPPSGGTPAQSAGAPIPLAANPVITALSANDGQPGDPLLITGTGLGEQAGEVHFIVANGVDLIAPVTHWNSSQAFVSVPEKTGVLAFAGQIYIVAANGVKSALTAFHFRPTIAVDYLTWTTDRRIAAHGTAYDYWHTNRVLHDNPDYFTGVKEDDEFYVNSLLQNGWLVENAELTVIRDTALAGVSVSDFRSGTNSPYVKVHAWMQPQILGVCIGCPSIWPAVEYVLRVRVIGPKGTSHGLFSSG